MSPHTIVPWPAPGCAARQRNRRLARGSAAACLLASLTGCAELLGIDDLSPPPDAGLDAGSLPPPTPTLRYPDHGSRLPGVSLFAWETPSAPELTYVLEYGADPELATGVTRVETDETSHRLDTDLPVSLVPPVGARYYWRVTACVRTRCSAPSRIWYFDLGRLFLDLNGDGHDDFLIGAPLDQQGALLAGAIYAYTGNLRRRGRVRR